jgi:hypothetical protein
MRLWVRRLRAESNHVSETLWHRAHDSVWVRTICSIANFIISGFIMLAECQGLQAPADGGQVGWPTPLDCKH